MNVAKAIAAVSNEGLLSYMVHITDQDFAVDKDGRYVPAKPPP